MSIILLLLALNGAGSAGTTTLPAAFVNTGIPGSLLFTKLGSAAKTDAPKIDTNENTNDVVKLFAN